MWLARYEFTLQIWAAFITSEVNTLLGVVWFSFRPRTEIMSLLVLLVISSFSQNNLTREIAVIKYSERSRHGLPVHNKFPKEM